MNNHIMLILPKSIASGAVVRPHADRIQAFGSDRGSNTIGEDRIP
jgi:hypothetical protein